MSLGKFQKKGMRYLNSLPHVVCKCSPSPMLPNLPATYSWYLDDMEAGEYFARMSETESAFIVLERSGFHRAFFDGKLYTTGGKTVRNMHELKIAVGKILQEIEKTRKDLAEYIKECKAKEIERAAGEYEV